MTIDEAIAHAREKAKQEYDMEIVYTDDYGVYNREKARCRECAEEHEQIAEWLEELKLFKELYPDSDVKGSLVTNYNNGWNDGIEKILKAYDEWQEYPNDLLFSDIIFNILSELKEKKNENV